MAAGIVVLAFRSGGFFAGATAAAAAVATLVLIVRLALVRRPLDGIGAWAGVAAGLLAIFLGWTVLSATWSDATARALIEANRVLLYLLVLVLVASVPRGERTPSVLAGWLTGALVVVCGAGFVSRTLPEVLEAVPNIADARLSYPVGYWNALGLLAAMGLVLCLHVAADARRPAAQAAGAAATPLLAATLILTFSRASILVAAVAVLLYPVLARPRGLVGALITTGPAVAVAVHAALAADLLATTDYTRPAAAEQGAELAGVVLIAAAACAVARLVATRLDDRIAHLLRRPQRRRAAAGLAAAAGVAVVAVALAAGAGGVVERRLDEFRANERVVEPGAPTKERLTSASSNDRILLWEVAVEASRQDRLQGTGAGTFVIDWNRSREPLERELGVMNVVDGHSLYLEILAELGVVGLALLLAVLAVALVALARHLRGPQRAAWAALLVVTLTWMAHAAQDWDWEMPAVTVAVFAVAGAAVARRRCAPDRPPPRPIPLLLRGVLVVACVALAVVPVQVWRSQVHLDRAVDAMLAGNCARAGTEARAASDRVGARPEPYEVLGICLARSGKGDAAVASLDAAIDRDPHNWELHYELALVRGIARRDPSKAAAAALRLNPHEPLAMAAVKAVRAGSGPGAWRRWALSAPLPGLAPPPGSGGAAWPSAGGPAPAPLRRPGRRGG